MSDSVKYDRFGFDSDGYNAKGFNKMGYNRQGYDKDGYNIHGYSEDGYFKLTGLNKEGYDRDGYDSEGFNHEGYNREGFDRKGYNRAGYNLSGYNIDGYDKYGYDSHGYDKEGFNKKGFSRYGFNVEGYNKSGFDKNGYNKKGYDKFGYDKEGFNSQGYNREGYNKEGFNSSGLDKEGFNYYGFNKYGFDREGYDQNGYDREGYGRDGFNKKGYDRNGYNKEGFNIDGYDKDGYDKLGFNKKGFNRQGYNKFGFDVNGYDIDGFNKKGYNKEGFDKEGYDKLGYNAEGFDRKGFDKKGFNINGYNVWGYDSNGYDVNGYDILGYNSDGYDINGYDREGFNSNGYTVEGFHKSDFDIDGYHIFTGFNLKGYDRKGFNINGIDSEGYDLEGYNVITGYNRDGFDKYGFNEEGIDAEGYNKDGFNNLGYNRKGFNSKGFNKYGRDVDGYDCYGYDAEGYDINGIDKNGNTRKKSVDDICKNNIVYHKDLGKAKVLNINKKKNTIYFEVEFFKTKTTKKFCSSNFNEFLSFTPQRQIIDMINSHNEKEYNIEKEHLNETLIYINKSYNNRLKEIIKNKWNSFNRKEHYIGKDGFVGVKTINHDKECENEYKSTITQIKNNPYFARVDYNKTSMYIGKHGIDNKVIDWSDSSCQYYYQYEMYLGSDNVTLSLVRDLSISNGELYGYVDKYNIKGNVIDQKKYTDERLVKIIEANRENKSVHDIIQSIQSNQYKIMISDIDNNMIVLGCAGSGKTMIMYHRLRYLTYNYKNIDLSSVYLISPTKILGVESHQLLKNLDISKANIVTVNDLILSMLKKYYDNLYFSCNSKIISSTSILSDSEIENIYRISYAKDIFKKIKSIYSYNSKEREAFINNQRKKINDSIELFKLAVSLKDDNLEEANKRLEHLCVLYNKAKEECKKHSKENIIAMKKSIIENDKKYFSVHRVYNIINYLLENDCFLAIENEESKEKLSKLKNYFNNATENKIIENILEITKNLFDFFANIEEESFDSIKFKTPILAIKHIIKEANLVGISIPSDIINKTLKFLQSTTKDYAIYILEKCQKIIKDRDNIVIKEGILDLLDISGYLGNSTRMYNGQAYNNFSQGFKNTFEFFYALEWNGEEVDKNYIINKDIKTPFDFISKYNNILEQDKRLRDFKHGHKGSYLFDLIYEHIEPNSDCLDNRTIKYEHQLVLNAYICTELFGAQDLSKKYLFFDEFQDLSELEIEFFYKALPNSVYNYYGDLVQCINPKGIQTEEELNRIISNAEIFYINENYRNSYEITNYVNKQLELNMTPIGISGKVIESKNFDFNQLSITKGDRVAFITKDKNNVSSEIIKSLNAIYFNQDDSDIIIPRGVPVIYSIQEVKGLEFENVIVDESGLNVNEKYVAFTRALNNLFILK